MKDRLKEMRIKLGKTQKEMSEQSGVTQAAYSMYESGKSTPSNAVINSLCKTFGVNEQWLRTGEGEMFVPKGDNIDELMTRYQLHPRCRRILETVLALPEPAQEAFCDFLDGMKGKMQKEDADLREQVKAEVRAEVEKELRAEMEQEKEDKETEALHVLLQAQIDRQKGDKGSTLVSGGTKSKEA